jgi:hypothetical protein
MELNRLVQIITLDQSVDVLLFRTACITKSGRKPALPSNKNTTGPLLTPKENPPDLHGAPLPDSVWCWHCC